MLFELITTAGLPLGNSRVWRRREFRFRAYGGAGGGSSASEPIGGQAEGVPLQGLWGGSVGCGRKQTAVWVPKGHSRSSDSSRMATDLILEVYHLLYLIGCDLLVVEICHCHEEEGIFPNLSKATMCSEGGV